MAKEPDEEVLPDENLEADIEEADEDLEAGDEGTESEADEAEEDTDEDADEVEESESTGATSASRRESRNARQARENRELREKLARLEGEREALNRKPADPEGARRAREEKLALMSPEERMAFEAKEETVALRNEARTTQFLLLDMQDKNSYDIMCTNDPVAAKYKAEVEDLLASMRKNNTNAPRETLLNYVIGKHAREAGKNKVGKKKIEQRRVEASVRVQQSKGKPTSARSDTGSSKGGDTVDALRQRILAREARGDVN